jgi:hypothetical protein
MLTLCRGNNVLAPLFSRSELYCGGAGLESRAATLTILNEIYRDFLQFHQADGAILSQIRAGSLSSKFFPIHYPLSLHIGIIQHELQKALLNKQNGRISECLKNA